MSDPSAVLLPPPTQVGSHIAGLDGPYPNPASENLAEKMSAVDRVLFDRKSAEVVFAHVFAQHDQPVINPMLFGNGASPGGGLLIG